MSFLSASFADLTRYMLTLAFQTLGGVIAILAKGLSYALVLRAGGSIPVVASVWKILRDFSNMMFVVILIYMAFATIFNQDKFSFSKLIVRFLMVAVLINFSLAIGNLIIDACQVLTNLFLGSIGNLGDRFGQFLNPSLLIPNAAGIGAQADLATSFVVSMIFSLVLLLIYFFSMLTAFIFAIVRIPIIWGLLIVSPVAWMAHILPGTNKTWNNWWGQFIGWNLFLPIYLFFIYLGLIFLSKQSEIISGVIQSNAAGNNPLSVPLIGDVSQTLTFNLLFFYIFAAFILGGGAWAAKSITGQFGSGFQKGLGWARTAAGRVTGYDSARKASEQKYKEFMNGATSRVPAIFSSAKQDTFFNRVLRTEAGRKGFPGEAKRALDKFEDDYDTGKLDVNELKNKVKSSSVTSVEGFAYRKLAIKKGVLDDKEFTDALIGSKNNPFAVQDLMKAAKDAKFAGIKDIKAIAFDTRLDSPNFTPAKREILLSIAGDAKKAAKLNMTDVDKAISILGGKDSPEAKKFLKDVGDARPDLIAARKSATSGKSGLREMYKLVYNTDAKKLSDMPLETWRDPDFQRALQVKITQMNKKNLPLPEGDIIARGTPLPPVPPGVTPIPLPNGSTLIPGRPGTIPRGPGISKFKGRLGGGDKFKASLDSATSANVIKNGIVARL